MNNETDNYVFVFDGQKWNTVDKTSFFNEIYEKKVYYYIKNFMNYIVNQVIKEVIMKIILNQKMDLVIANIQKYQNLKIFYINLETI